MLRVLKFLLILFFVLRYHYAADQKESFFVVSEDKRLINVNNFVKYGLQCLFQCLDYPQVSFRKLKHTGTDMCCQLWSGWICDRAEHHFSGCIMRNMAILRRMRITQAYVCYYLSVLYSQLETTNITLILQVPMWSNSTWHLFSLCNSVRSKATYSLFENN